MDQEKSAIEKAWDRDTTSRMQPGGDLFRPKSQDSVMFVVLGVARPKGSTRAFMRPGMKFPIVTSDNKSVKGWEQSVRAAIQQHCEGVFFNGPLRVRITFDLPRPKSMPKRISHHVKKPDVDKLARGSLDAMKGALWNDDSQVVELHVKKRYGLMQPQAFIEVQAVSTNSAEWL
jgi:Holliday junction resolvase RusA-like endonuclease